MKKRTNPNQFTMTVPRAVGMRFKEQAEAVKLTNVAFLEVVLNAWQTLSPDDQFAAIQGRTVTKRRGAEAVARG